MELQVQDEQGQTLGRVSILRSYLEGQITDGITSSRRTRPNFRKGEHIT